MWEILSDYKIIIILVIKTILLDFASVILPATAFNDIFSVSARRNLVEKTRFSWRNTAYTSNLNCLLQYSYFKKSGIMREYHILLNNSEFSLVLTTCQL